MMVSIQARTIAIIGAGPSGLVAAKYLRAEKVFDKIVIFEQRSRGGGIWNYTPESYEELSTIPQTNPRHTSQDPAWRSPKTNGNKINGFRKSSDQGGVKNEAYFLSPIYDRLETNIPRGLMGFQDLDWPHDSQLFPKHETVLQYITEYGADVQDLVRYETQVLDVSPTNQDPTGSWDVMTRDILTNQQQEETFDAVIVANGHFIVPYVPDIPGIREWNKAFPGSISHSKYFRRAEDFTGKKVIVVGNSASGVDISSQIATVSRHPLLWSSRSTSMFKPAPSSLKLEFPPIANFLPDARGIEFEDGRVEHDVDAIVFATGYFYSLPFLEKVAPKLIGDGSHVQSTYQHLFYAPRPTLSFLVLNQRVIPFPVAEAQSAVLARVYSGRLSLPSFPEMRQWEEGVISERGNGKNFHLLPFPKDGNYINELSTWAMDAPSKDGLDNDGKGKVPPVWGDWEFWCRENFPAIRQAFGARGQERFNIRSIEELGFSYEEHLKKKASGETKTL
jgi:cation diffusion facilitator CzcD-associated flavoprotein CzcO